MWSFSKYLKETFEVSDAEWELINRRLEIVDLPRNEFFIQSGKVCRKTGFVLEGVMRYFSTDAQGDEPTCFFSFEGHYVIDPYAYKEQKASSLNLKSITDCQIAVMSFEDDKQLMVEYPKWKEITTAMLLAVSMEFAGQKEMMSLNAASRYEYFISHYPQLVLTVPLQYIASYLGIAQPSLSRLRKQMAGANTKKP